MEVRPGKQPAKMVGKRKDPTTSSHCVDRQAARPDAAHRSIQLGMSWKRRQELLIEFERHEHANLHDANAD
jgi:hypothetical protein